MFGIDDEIDISRGLVVFTLMAATTTLLLAIYVCICKNMRMKNDDRLPLHCQDQTLIPCPLCNQFLDKNVICGRSPSLHPADCARDHAEVIDGLDKTEVTCKKCSRHTLRKWPRGAIFNGDDGSAVLKCGNCHHASAGGDFWTCYLCWSHMCLQCEENLAGGPSKDVRIPEEEQQPRFPPSYEECCR